MELDQGRSEGNGNGGLLHYLVWTEHSREWGAIDEIRRDTKTDSGSSHEAIREFTTYSESQDRPSFSRDTLRADYRRGPHLEGPDLHHSSPTLRKSNRRRRLEGRGSPVERHTKLLSKHRVIQALRHGKAGNKGRVKSTPKRQGVLARDNVAMTTGGARE